MGFPRGWTLPTGPRLEAEPSPLWPRGRYPESWDRSVYWPGYEWEPPRTLPDGPPCPGRPARIRACGNAVVPQQGALAIKTALRPKQASLCFPGRGERPAFVVEALRAALEREPTLPGMAL